MADMSNMTRQDLKSLTVRELQELPGLQGQPAFRSGQIFSWIQKYMVTDAAQMTNLPAALREKLLTDYDICQAKTANRLVSGLDGTRKYVFELADGNRIETVLMRYRYGNSICISSQVGCRMGCRFCASTLDGLVRNLTPGEMLEQIYAVSRDIGEHISHIVVMGTGEPLDNFDGLLRVIELVSDRAWQGISRRNITVSTCGLVPRIKELGARRLPITLALSLHAPTDALRRETMPIAMRYTIEETLAACDEYYEMTGRRISYEYSLIREVNDEPGHAEQLSRLLKGRNCHVNLIPINPIRERDYRTSEKDRVGAFKKILEKNGINATIRRKMGADIDSACGQLRRSRSENKENACDIQQ